MKWWDNRFEQYSVSSFKKDVMAGLIVGVIAIPLAMAFAIASGVKPEYGIYTSILAGIFVSLFGGSKYQIAGPTGAFVPILLAIVMQYGYENLLIAGFLAGVMLILMGVFKLGSLIQFIPRPVTVGFTSGIAVIIFSGQIANFLGMDNIPKHDHFLDNMKEIALHLDAINPYSVMISLIGLAILMMGSRFFPKIPSSLVAILISSVIATLFFSGKVATISTTFGDIPRQIPMFHLPSLTWEKVELMFRPALVIALLGGIESLLSAVVADEMKGTRHHSNRELIGQGIANVLLPLFGGIAATGAIARTATNIKNGAVSPLSGVVHSLVVLMVLLLFAPYASDIPLASMAPILMLVAWNMSERKNFMYILKTKSSDSLVLLLTFLLTVFMDLTTAVEAGMGLAVILFVKNMSQLLTIEKVLPDPNDHHHVRSEIVTEEHDCPQINIYNIQGSLFFGTAQSFEQCMSKPKETKPHIVILRMKKMMYLDTTGEVYLSRIIHHLQQQGITVFISGMEGQPRALIHDTRLDQRIGTHHFYEHIGDTIHHALPLVNKQKCLGCKHFAFQECQLLSQEKR